MQTLIIRCHCFFVYAYKMFFAQSPQNYRKYLNDEAMLLGRQLFYCKDLQEWAV